MTFTTKLKGDAGRAIDGINQGLSDASTKVQRRQPKETATTTHRASQRLILQASPNEWVMVNPSGSLISINVPASPGQGDKFRVKNVTALSSSFSINAAGSELEVPTALGTFTTGSLSITTSGFGGQWTWLGTGTEARWYIVERPVGL